MELPPPVKTYFEAEERNDVETLVAAFADDAVVRDEGISHAGPDAIRTWWLAAKETYNHVIEPVDVTETGSKISVHAKVSGQFPSSPVTLEFVFGLEGDKLTGLEIR